MRCAGDSPTAFSSMIFWAFSTDMVRSRGGPAKDPNRRRNMKAMVGNWEGKWEERESEGVGL